jgi:type II secretory pathway component PulF
VALEIGTKEARRERPAARAWSLVGAVTVRDRMLFIERLAMLLETGMPLHAALETLAQQCPHPRLADAIRAMAEEIVAGKTLAAAFVTQGNLFPGAYASLVAAAEAGGFLPEALNQLTELEDRQERLHSALVGALVYPAFLAGLSALVVVYVLVGVFPKFAEMFESIRDQLPASTIILIAVSDALRQHWALIGVAIAAAAGSLIYWLRTPSGGLLLDRAKLKLPLLRDLFMQSYMARVMRVMGTSLGNRVSVIDTIAACRETVQNREFQRFLGRVEQQVMEGRGFARAFQEEAAIPAMVRQMIATGDQTGKLALVMSRIADFYERELLRRIAILSKLAEPVMLLVMGVAVGVIVTSLILPIFKLAKGVH